MYEKLHEYYLHIKYYEATYCSANIPDLHRAEYTSFPLPYDIMPMTTHTHTFTQKLGKQAIYNF